MKRISSFTIVSLLGLIGLVLAGCGTTQMNAVTGEGQSIGHQTSGYSLTETGTVWNATAPPSHTTLTPDGNVDTISPIQPSLITLAGDELPFRVLVSSAADYSIDDAAFTKSADGSISLTVSGFGADRSAVLEQVMRQVYDAVTAQVESGSMTQREALQTMGAVAQAIAELGLQALVPAP